MSLLPDYKFNKRVARYNGDYRIKEFTCKEHFLVMSFAQLTYRDSLRDIESCLQAVSHTLRVSQTGRFTRAKWPNLSITQRVAWLFLIEETLITNGYTIWTPEISISLQEHRTTWITKSRKLMKRTLNQGLFTMITSDLLDKNLARTTLTHLKE